MDGNVILSYEDDISDFLDMDDQIEKVFFGKRDRFDLETKIKSIKRTDEGHCILSWEVGT